MEKVIKIKLEENFISGVQSQRGVHSSEIKIEWNKSKNWLNLLVSAEKHRRKEIIFSYLKLDSYKDVDSLDAFEQLDPYINNVSERALIDYFEKNKVVHEAVEAMAKQRNYGLMISQLGWEILNWERKMLKKNSCPEMFFTPARLILFRVECEDDNHRRIAFSIIWMPKMRGLILVQELVLVERNLALTMLK